MNHGNQWEIVINDSIKLLNYAFHVSELRYTNRHFSQFLSEQIFSFQHLMTRGKI
jgi:hypothetical protein